MLLGVSVLICIQHHADRRTIKFRVGILNEAFNISFY